LSQVFVGTSLNLSMKKNYFIFSSFLLTKAYLSYASVDDVVPSSLFATRL